MSIVGAMINRKIPVAAVAFVLLMLVSGALAAQNFSYSQYQFTPLFTNPSLLAMKSEASFTFIHRTEQITPDVKFNTSALGATYALIREKDNRRLGGAGIAVIRDAQDGDAAFRVQGISGGYAYNLNVEKNHYISFGLQAGYFERRINGEGYTTGSQWVENVGFDRSAPIGEVFTDERTTYFTLGSGITWYVEDDNGRNIFNVGMGANHLNGPSVAFYGDDERLEQRYTAHGWMAVLKNDKLLLGPEMLFIHQNRESLVSPGAAMSYYFENDNPFSTIKSGSVDVRARYAIDHALVVGLQFNQPNFSVGFTYDFGVGGAEVLSANRNATELMFTVRKLLGGKRKTERVVIDNYTIGEVRDFYANDKVRYFGKDADEKDTEKLADESDEESYDWEGDNYQFELRKDFSFGFNDAELNDEAKVFLDDIIKLLNSNNKLFMEVIGHTDNIGTSQANKKVSLMRSQAVIDYLVEQGINPKRLKVTGKGATEPLVPNDSEANRSKNRRVEFIIYTK